MRLLENTLRNIKGLDPEISEQARLYQDSLTKPLGGLGRLKEVAIQPAASPANSIPKITGKRVVVFREPRVVAEGVSAYPQEVSPPRWFKLPLGKARASTPSLRSAAQAWRWRLTLGSTTISRKWNA